MTLMEWPHVRASEHCTLCWNRKESGKLMCEDCFAQSLPATEFHRRLDEAESLYERIEPIVAKMQSA